MAHSSNTSHARFQLNKRIYAGIISQIVYVTNTVKNEIEAQARTRQT